MKLSAKRWMAVSLLASLIMAVGAVVFAAEHQAAARAVVVPPESAACIKCHGEESKDGKPGIDPGVVKQWQASVHASLGIGCFDCHGMPAATAKEDEVKLRYVVKVAWDKQTGLKTIEPVMADGKPVERPDIWTHEGAEIVTNVTPRTCERCHAEEAAQFSDSRHSSASQFIGSIDNFLGRFAEGPAAAVSGCQQCHGSVVQLAAAKEAGKTPRYSPDAWPNTGIGRVNLDGSWGSCSACHSRHEFAAEVARRPENCGKCHLGPDHPQFEVYSESKHGIAFAKNQNVMNLGQPGQEWVLGKDYAQAPTCSSCHMGPVAPHGTYSGLKLTHDAGARISWTLRPMTSIKPKAIVKTDGTVVLKGPDERRADMKQACLTCHAPNWVDNFYIQFDQVVDLYNHKFAAPLAAISDYLVKEKLIDSVPMNEKLEFVIYELWHHEGRRARHGAAMMGPDYVQWHGFYEVTRNFYTELLPLVKETAAKKGKLKAVEAFLEQTLHGADGKDWEQYHAWSEGLTQQQKEAMLDWEKSTYKARL